MGCAGSKPPELIAQPKSDALIEGIVSASVETTVKVPDCLGAKRFVLGKNVKLKIDGRCVATVECRNDGLFSVPKESFAAKSRHPCYSYLVRSEEGKMVALLKKQEQRVIVNNWSKWDMAIYGFNEDYKAIIYGVRPRVEGCAPALTIEGTDFFEWYLLKPSAKDPAVLPPYTGEGVSGALATRTLEICHYDEKGFGAAALRVRRKQCDAPYHMTSEADGAAVGYAPQVIDITSAGGVDPLLLPLAVLEWTAYDHEWRTCAAM